jgi:hypothetical protein
MLNNYQRKDEQKCSKGGKTFEHRLGYSMLGVTNFGHNIYFTELQPCAGNDTLDYFARVIRHIDWIATETGLDRSDLLASSAVSLPRSPGNAFCLSILLWCLVVFIVFDN